MKRNTLTEIKNESIGQLEARLLEEKKELASLYLDLSLKKLKNTRAVFHKRKDISKLLTILNDKRRQK